MPSLYLGYYPLKKHYFQITIFKVIQRWANDQANTFY